VDATGDDAAQDYRVVRGELAAYDAELANKPEIVALSKCDAVDAEEAARKQALLAAECGQKPMLLSAVSGQNVRAALFALGAYINEAKADEAAEAAPQSNWQP